MTHEMFKSYKLLELNSIIRVYETFNSIQKIAKKKLNLSDFLIYFYLND